ncbi:MAG: DASH complex subunit Dad2-domain-containing protein [Linnemannia elongata]|nr:MAG: DASH complex subunit Dad2-domain-containing protein [Linnemannia elongata]
MVALHSIFLRVLSPQHDLGIATKESPHNNTVQNMSSTAPPHLLQRMQEKKQELEHLLALRQLASHLQTHFDELSEKFDGLMQGNQATSNVLENWAGVFRTIDLTEKFASQDQDQQEQEKSSLVRIPTA